MALAAYPDRDASPALPAATTTCLDNLAPIPLRSIVPYPGAEAGSLVNRLKRPRQAPTAARLPSRLGGSMGGMRSTRRCVIASLLLVLLWHGLPNSAQASPETLRRSFSNIIGGPMDMLLSPITATLTVARNLTEIEDSTGVRLVYAIPGIFWLTGVDLGSGMIRCATGLLELPPGVFLFPFETDIDTLFDPVDDAGALIDLDNPLMWIENPWVYYNPLVAPFAIQPKWGINYTRAEF